VEDRRRTVCAPFAALGVAAREATLEKALVSLELLGFAVELAKLATYSSAAVGEHLGYSGANAGTGHDADSSYARPMAREITRDGNLP
jgi:hypothetical protein